MLHGRADYFNPAFIEHHGQANAQASICRHLITTKSQLPAPITSLSLSTTEIGARNVDFQLTTPSDGQQALQGCLRLQEPKDNGVKTDLSNAESEKLRRSSALSPVPFSAV